MSKELPKRYNRICEKCLRRCKQPRSVKLLSCPRFEVKPVQLEIKVPGLGKRFKEKA
jgi:hypothetical protein